MKDNFVKSKEEQLLSDICGEFGYWYNIYNDGKVGYFTDDEKGTGKELIFNSIKEALISWLPNLKYYDDYYRDNIYFIESL
jgi:hypothetical protein